MPGPYTNMVHHGRMQPYTVVLIDDKTGEDAIWYGHQRDSDRAMYKARLEYPGMRPMMVFPVISSPINGIPANKFNSEEPTEWELVK